MQDGEQNLRGLPIEVVELDGRANGRSHGNTNTITFGESLCCARWLWQRGVDGGHARGALLENFNSLIGYGGNTTVSPVEMKVSLSEKFIASDERPKGGEWKRR
ncbi:hypothetical protein ACGLFO_06180 [Corynebacterium hesseae]|uniref:hypothetical protein n=1 Tax=Corynebacterium hesseae TaxID=2913502 RepID=UPI00373EFB1C